MSKISKIIILGSLLVSFFWLLKLNSDVKDLRIEKKILREALIEVRSEKDSLEVRIDQIDSIIVDYDQRTPNGSPLKAPNPRINSYFGWRKDPVTKKRMFHNGIDLKAYKWYSVYSTATGKVEEICNCTGGHGRYVIIDHGNGYKTKYSHLIRILVKEGDHIDRNSIIGRVGSTGRATGPHLHYEIEKNEKRVDPIRYL